MSALTPFEEQCLSAAAKYPGGLTGQQIAEELDVTAASYYQTLAHILTTRGKYDAARDRHPQTVARLEQQIKERGAQRAGWITGSEP